MQKLKNIAIILAGGSGNRFASNLPKQFSKIENKTILEYSIDAFEQNKQIDEIIVVSNPSFIEKTQEIIQVNSFTKIKAVLGGGKERYHSSLTAINFIENECNLIFHDAVRPFVSQQIIDNIIQALSTYNAVNVAVPASDTILEVTENKNFIKEIPDRNFLFQAQTPQAFRWSAIKKAYQIGLKDDNFKVTDDCGVVKNYLPQEAIFVVKGEQTNIKITYPSDIELAKILLNKIKSI